MFAAGFDLEQVKDVPQDVQRQVAGVSLELQQQELSTADSLTKGIAGLEVEYQEKLRAIIGGDKLEQYYQFRAPLRARMHDVTAKAAPTIVGHREIQEARREVAEKSRRGLREIGFDMARASVLRGEFHKRFQEMISEALDRPEEPNYVVLPEMVPKEVHNPWKVFSPPYPGWAWAYWWYKSDEPCYPGLTRYLNSAAGQIGTYSRICVYGADDSDSSYVRYRTAMRFWYRVPAAGMAEVWMKMRCIDTPYSGMLDDEWGWSDSSCDQESHAYVRAIVPGPGALRKSTILDYRRTGTDANWSRHVASTNAHRWAHLFSADAYPGGSWVLLEVGTEEWNRFWSNDVTVNSTMTMKWLLERVYVRSTGE